MQAAAQVDTVMDPRLWAVSETYAQAMLDLLAEDADAEEFDAELHALQELMDRMPEAKALLCAALLTRRERVELTGRVFAGRVSEKMEALLMLLARNGRFVLLPGIRRSFRHRLNQREGKVEVTVTTAAEVDAEQKRAVADLVREELDAEPLVTWRKDPSLIGGMILRVGDRVIDASVASELRKMTQALLRRKLGG